MSIVDATVIAVNDAQPVVTLYGETQAGTLAGLTLQGGLCGVQCNKGRAILRHCHITGSAGSGIVQFPSTHMHLAHCIVAAHNGAGIRMQKSEGTRVLLYSHATIESSTIVQNGDAGILGGKISMTNSIVYLNGPKDSPQLLPDQAAVNYSCIQNLAIVLPDMLHDHGLGYDLSPMTH